MEYTSAPQQRAKRDLSAINPSNLHPTLATGVELQPKRAKIDHQSAVFALDSHAATKLTHLISKLKDLDAERSHVVNDIRALYPNFEQESYLELLGFLNNTVGALKANVALAHKPDGSYRKQVKAKRDHEKDLVFHFTRMVTGHCTVGDDSGIEKPKLWQFFSDFTPENEAVTPPVFWKYIKGQKYKGATAAVPPFENEQQSLKTVLKGGVKRMSGVRWLNPSDPTDFKQMQEAHSHLNEMGFQFDFGKVTDRLKLLYDDHEASEKALKAARQPHGQNPASSSTAAAPAENHSPASAHEQQHSNIATGNVQLISPTNSGVVIVPDNGDTLLNSQNAGALSPSLSQMLAPANSLGNSNPLGLSTAGLSNSTAELLMGAIGVPGGLGSSDMGLVPSTSEKWNPLLQSWDPTILGVSTSGALSPTGNSGPAKQYN